MSKFLKILRDCALFFLVLYTLLKVVGGLFDTDLAWFIDEFYADHLRRYIHAVYFYDVIMVISSFCFAFAGTAMAYVALKKLNVLDVPIERSNHSIPTPRGGGLGIVFALAGFLVVVNAPGIILLSVLALCFISFWDDIKPLTPRFRLGAQALAVVATLWSAYGLNPSARVFLDVVPLWVELPLIALGWMWFINLFNFMDGSDGLAAGEAISVSLGIVFMSWTLNMGVDAPLYAVIIVGSVLGFALWNWHPAKIFMGDAGSIPLGYLLGFTLIEVARSGWWAIALILPAYFVADATLVLVRRGLRGEKLWHAHSEHAYQRAIRGGMQHDEVARWVITLNIGLWVLAALSTLGLTFAIATTILAYAASMWLIVAFKRGGQGLIHQAA